METVIDGEYVILDETITPLRRKPKSPPRRRAVGINEEASSLFFWTPLATAAVGAALLAVFIVAVIFHFYPPKPSGFNWSGAAIAACYYGMFVCGISATGLSVKLGFMIREDRRRAKLRKWNEKFSTGNQKETDER